MSTHIIAGIDNVFSATLNKDKKSVNFIELCDYYYEQDVTKEEMTSLISDLTKLLNQMED